MAEENHYQELLENEQHNLSKIWELFGAVINENKIKRKTKINKLICKNKEITSDQEIANAIDDHSVLLEKNWHQISKQQRLHEVPPHTNQTLFGLTSTSKSWNWQNYNTIAKKACGDDQIQPKHLKLCRESITNPITQS